MQGIPFFDKTISMNRLAGSMLGEWYNFELIEACPEQDDGQAYVYVNRTSQCLDYRECVQHAIRCPLDDMFDFSTPERVIQSLRLFHQDFLTQHGITIEAHNAPVQTMEPVRLPEGFDV